MDYRSLYSNEYVGAWDLDGREVTVTIGRCIAKKIVGEGGKTDQKPVLYFRRPDGSESPKALIVNKTNGRTIATIYGTDTARWVGQRITLYPATTSVSGRVVDCVRVRPVKPSGAAEEPPNRPEPPAAADSEETK